MEEKTINVTIAGLGGQGILRASDILAESAFRAGFDVKKSEIHGMSQRGGSVTSDVRFGKEVLSPMIPEGETDYLIVIDPTQIDVTKYLLKPSGKLIEPSLIDAEKLPNKRSLNIALLGVLSNDFPEIKETIWVDVIKETFAHKPDIAEINLQAFAIGRNVKK